MPYDILKGSAVTPLLFFMTDGTDHLTGKANLTPSVTISKNGGAFASASGATSSLGAGWFAIAGNATDSNTAGPVALHATGTSCDACDMIVAQVIDPAVTIYGANIGQVNGQSASAAAGVAFPAQIASPTNITSGTVSIGAGGIASTAFTNGAVNASALAANAISATTFAAGALNASAIAANAITASTFANGAINASAIAANAITAATFAANAINASGVAADAVAKIQTGLSTLTQANVRTAVGLASANLDTQLAAIDGDVLSRLATAGYTAPPTTGQIATAVFTTQFTESYRANGSAPTLSQYACEVLAHLGETTIAGTTKTIKKFDHSATAATFSIDSATIPTSILRAS